MTRILATVAPSLLPPPVTGPHGSVLLGTGSTAQNLRKLATGRQALRSAYPPAQGTRPRPHRDPILAPTPLQRPHSRIACHVPA